MTNKEVIDYITKTPHNTNPTILKQHLEEQDAELLNNSGAGGLGVQADWNQNDETAPDFVKNRPFYSYIGYEDIAYEEFTLEADGEGPYIQSTLKLSPSAGHNFKIVFDGIEYICETKSVKDPSTGSMEVGIGNESLRFEGYPDSGEPFYIYCTYWGVYVFCVYSSAGEHTFQVFWQKEKQKQIDEKYFPDDFIRKENFQVNWNQHNSFGPGYIANKPFSVFINQKEECFPEITFNSQGDNNNPEQLTGATENLLDDYYVVFFDQVYYNCERLRSGGYGNGKVKYSHELDTGEPFYFYSLDPNTIRIYSTPGEHTIQIYKAEEFVHKLAEKYLPDSVKSKPDWNQYDENGPGYIKNRTHYADCNIYFDGITTVSPDSQDGYYTYRGLLRGLTAEETEKIRYSSETFQVVFDDEVIDINSPTDWYIKEQATTFLLHGTSTYISCDNNCSALYINSYGDISGYQIQVRTKENLKQLDEKFIPESIARVKDIPETLAQPDWDARESESGHIKNRPFYYTVSPGSNVIVEEESLYVPKVDPSYAMFNNSDNVSLISEDYYTVIFDGVEYLCKCSILTGGIYGAYSVLGNRALVYNLGSSADEKVDTGEPFAIVGGSNYSTYLYCTETGRPHTVKVLDAEVKFVPISEKYLSDGINRNNLLYKPVKEPILDRVLTAKVSGPPNYYFYNLGQAEGVDSSFTEGWLYFKNRYYKFTVGVEFKVTLTTESGVVELPVEVRNRDGSFDIASRDSWDTAQVLNLFHDVVRIYPADGVSFVELPEEYTPTSDYHLATKKYVDSSFSTVVKTEPQSLTRKQKNQIKSNLDISTGDWGQNDSSKCDFIKNRTHWSNGMKTSRISTLSYLLDDEETTTDELGRRVTTLSEVDDQPVEDQFYTVLINGQKVPDVLCHRLDSEDGTSCLCLGEPADAEFSPLCFQQFKITFNPETDEVFVAINPEVFGEHINTIGVYQEYEYEDVVPLDKKFLPKATAVPDATGETVTATEFNALLNALREAGYLET